MANIFLDSSDHYDSGQLGYKYETVNFGSVDPNGLHGAGLRSPHVLATPNPIVGSTTAIIGEAVFWRGFNFEILWQFSSGGVQAGSAGAAIQFDGAIQIYYSPGRFFGASPAGVIIANTWNYIEGKFVLDVNGSIEIRVNGVVVVSASGINLIPLGSSPFNWDAVVRGGAGADRTGDDFYVNDGTGTAGHDYFGAVEIDVIRPNGAGVSAGWTSSTANPNWQNVDEHSPNDDVDYNTSNTPGALDLFEMEDIGVADTIVSAQYMICGRRTEAGFGIVAPVLREGGVNFVGSGVSHGATYAYYLRRVYMTAPSGAAWTPTNFNAIQAGYQKV